MNNKGFVFWPVMAIIALGTAVGIAGQYAYDKLREEETVKEEPLMQEYIEHHAPRYRARRI